MNETFDIQELNERIQRESAFVDILNAELRKNIVGQRHMLESLMISLLANGHILLEGVPGLAKTLTITSLANAIQAKFSRIQFTPDLLPADLVGTMIYSPKSETFSVKKGPIFSNFILADEINRAPAKVQSALLEAMQERQVTIGENTYKLEEPFLVLATQNPIEQEDISVARSSGGPLYDESGYFVPKKGRRKNNTTPSHKPAVHHSEAYT